MLSENLLDKKTLETIAAWQFSKKNNTVPENLIRILNDITLYPDCSPQSLDKLLKAIADWQSSSI